MFPYSEKLLEKPEYTLTPLSHLITPPPHVLRINNRKHISFKTPKFLRLDRCNFKSLGCRPIFSPDMLIFYGLTSKELRRLLFKYEESQQIKPNFNAVVT